MLVLNTTVGLRAALVAAGAIGPLVAIFLMFARGLDGDLRATKPASTRATHADRRRARVLTPAILGLTAFFALLSLSTTGISNFSVVALMSAYAVPFSAANLALTAFLTASAFGVLGGGFVADMTRRHGDVAAVGFALNAVIILLIGTVGGGPAMLIVAMGLAGFLSGMIMPSRDMLVRAAAPPGAVGRTFGIVTTGFSVGGTIGPMLFGWIMDCGAPRWVFGASVIFMLLTVVLALAGDRPLRRRRAAIAPVESGS
jgi:MFS family permease